MFVLIKTGFARYTLWMKFVGLKSFLSSLIVYYFDTLFSIWRVKVTCRVYHHFKFLVECFKLLVEFGHLISFDWLSWINYEVFGGVLVRNRVNVENLPSFHFLLHSKSLYGFLSKLATTSYNQQTLFSKHFLFFIIYGSKYNKI